MCMDSNHSSCNASYVLPCRCMFGIINLTAVFASKNGKYFPVDIAVFSFLLRKDAIVINMYDGLSNLRSETRLKLLNL